LNISSDTATEKGLQFRQFPFPAVLCPQSYPPLHHNSDFYCAVQARPSKRTKESLENTIIALPTFSETARNSLFFVQNDGDFLHLFWFGILSYSERAKNEFSLFELPFTMNLYESENN